MLFVFSVSNMKEGTRVLSRARLYTNTCLLTKLNFALKDDIHDLRDYDLPMR